MRLDPRTSLALAVTVAVGLAGSLAIGAAPAAAKGKKDKSAHVISTDLTALGLAEPVVFTLERPEGLWRAHLARMDKYPSRNQLTQSELPPLAERWLLTSVADGRAFDAQVFVMFERGDSREMKTTANSIAFYPETMFPFEDTVFDGAWIVNPRKFRVAGKKRVQGVMLENSGHRLNSTEKLVYQFALLPMPGDYHVIVGAIRTPTSTTAGHGGGGSGQASATSTTSVGDAAGVPGVDGGPGGTGDGAIGGGDSGPQTIDTSPNDADNNQTRVSADLIHEIVEGIHLSVPKKLRKGLRRFQLRDEWNSSEGLTSRFVSMSVPATWDSTPTTALDGDRIEWRERDKDGAVTTIARVEFLSASAEDEIASLAQRTLASRDLVDTELQMLTTRDGTSSAVVCPTETSSEQGLRRGDDESWLREFGYVLAEFSFYEVEILRPAGTPSQLDRLKEILESVEIHVFY